MQKSHSLLDLTLTNAQYSDLDITDVQVLLINNDIPPEIVTRIIELWGEIKIIAGEVINIGRMIVGQLYDFIKQYPHMITGLALGALASLFASSIPFIGAILAPLIGSIGVLYAGAKGLAMDTNYADEIQMIIACAKDFFVMFFQMLKSIAEYFQA